MAPSETIFLVERLILTDMHIRMFIQKKAKQKQTSQYSTDICRNVSSGTLEYTSIMYWTSPIVYSSKYTIFRIFFFLFCLLLPLVKLK